MTTLGSQSVANADAILKTLYSDKRVKQMGYTGNPTLALLPKMTRFTGKSMTFPIWYGGNHGTSRTFADAQQNKTGGNYTDFTITRTKDYGLTSIDTEALFASEGDAGAFLSLARSEIDGLVRNVSRNLSLSCFRNSGGARGVVGALASNVITLANIYDICHFEVGMMIGSSATDGTSGTAPTNQTRITAVDRRLGRITVASATGIAVSHFLFRDGDFGLSIAGFDMWLPATAPAAGENFFGVDRSVDTRLHGQFLNAAAMTKVEALEELDTVLVNEGGMPDVAIVNPFDHRAIRSELGSDVVFDKAYARDGDYLIGFDALSLASASGQRVKIVADRNCEKGKFYMLQLDTWELCSLGGAPRILPGSVGGMGQNFIWDHDGDSVEVRVAAYAQLACHAPGYNGRGSFV